MGQTQPGLQHPSEPGSGAWVWFCHTASQFRHQLLRCTEKNKQVCKGFCNFPPLHPAWLLLRSEQGPENEEIWGWGGSGADPGEEHEELWPMGTQRSPHPTPR